MSQMRKTILLLSLLGLICSGTGCKTKKQKMEEAMQRPSLSPKRSEKLLADVNETQILLDSGAKSKQVKAAYKLIKQDYAELVDFDLGLFSEAEIFLAKNKKAKAVKKYQKLTDLYPLSELIDYSHARLFNLGQYYLTGPVIANMLLFKIRGYERGIKVLEDLTEEVGIDEPNGLGVRSTIAIAENLESRNKPQDAYLKWLELSTAWDEGNYRRMALLGMARTKLAAYKIPKESRWIYYDGANLTNSKEYYLQFAQEFPEDANEMNVSDIVKEIDELMAEKQLMIARYYDRTGKKRAANLYFDMIIDNWPQTVAAQDAREIMAGKLESVE